MTTARSRQAPGTPVGGQFATEARTESQVTLAPADPEARAALDLLDELNAAGRLEYADYSALHDAISQIPSRADVGAQSPADEGAVRSAARDAVEDLENDFDVGRGYTPSADQYVDAVLGAVKAHTPAQESTVDDPDVTDDEDEDVCTHEITEWGRCAGCGQSTNDDRDPDLYEDRPTRLPVGCAGRGWYHDGSELEDAHRTGRAPKPCPTCKGGAR